jgi:hypothetical protein
LKNVNSRIYETIILFVGLHGCDTWSLTLGDEHRLRVIENKVLRRIFGPKRVEVTRGWRKLHNKELHNFCCLPSISRMIKSRRVRWEGAFSTNGGEGNVYRLMIGKPEGKNH